MLNEKSTTVHDLKLMKKHQVHLKELYKAASCVMLYDPVKHDLECRIREVDKVEEQQGILLNLCQKVDSEVSLRGTCMYILTFYGLSCA